MGSDAESEAKLAAPKLFGRKKPARTPEAAAERGPDADAPVAESPAERPEENSAEDSEEDSEEAGRADDTLVHASAVAPAADADADAAAEQPVLPATAAPQPRATKPPRAARTGRARSGMPRLPGLPGITGMQAAAITGLVVGGFLVLATYGALNLCSTVRGASTCGGRAGFPLLLAIGLVAVVGGGTLLRAFGVTSPMGDSFLAVALVVVLTVLFLNDHYGAWWMILVVPALSIAAFLLAHWVSTTYIDPVDD